MHFVCRLMCANLHYLLLFSREKRVCFDVFFVLFTYCLWIHLTNAHSCVTSKQNHRRCGIALLILIPKYASISNKSIKRTQSANLRVLLNHRLLLLLFISVRNSVSLFICARMRFISRKKVFFSVWHTHRIEELKKYRIELDVIWKSRIAFFMIRRQLTWHNSHWYWQSAKACFSALLILLSSLLLMKYWRVSAFCFLSH